MIIDERTEFADAAGVAAAAGTALIGDVLDSSSIARDLGMGEDIYLVITCATEIITGGVAGTVKFQLVSDAQAAIAVDGTATVHLDSGTFATGAANANDPQLNAGEVIFVAALPMQGKVYERYLGVLAVTATTATTGGAINAFLTLDPPRGKKLYAEGAN